MIRVRALKVIKNIFSLIKNVNNIIIVGAMANNFLAFKGFQVGRSLVEKNSKQVVDAIYSEAKKYSCSIFIPEDSKVSVDFEG